VNEEVPVARERLGAREAVEPRALVGQPRDGDPDAGYAVLDTPRPTRSISIELRTTSIG